MTLSIGIRGLIGYCVFFSFFLLLCISCGGLGYRASAEEYYAIGMAYFDLGKYPEAEQWLNRAKVVDKTKVASEYNLGRIAFETKQYTEALGYFEKILARDPVNLIALKAVAYTYIKLGNIEKAEALYQQVLALVPESADDGYNYALVLYAMEKYDQSEQALAAYPFALQENKDVLLLFARAQKAQQKPEAVDSYAQWFEAEGKTDDPLIHYEYASVLETSGFYARAIEAYKTILENVPQQGSDAQRVSSSLVRFSLARSLLIADAENEEGITELTAALREGFKDMDALEALMEEEGISEDHKGTIRRLIDEGPPVEEEAEVEDLDTEASEDLLGERPESERKP
ncbi:MAG: tetratricopeptide repeat protein [Treponema sp.]|jgi:tetratricopeptide (TPR) repeat protein|nr:tetratricopeptide repeat protein [Treponema sp.]